MIANTTFPNAKKTVYKLDFTGDETTDGSHH